MSFSLLFHKAQGNGSGVTAAADSSGCSLIVVEIGATDAAPVAPPTDTYGNTWTGFTSRPSSFGGAGRLFYCANPTVGAGHTFTSGGTLASICVAGFGGAAASPYDQDASQANIGSPNGAGTSLTPSQDNCLVVAALGGAGAVPTIDGGFTISDATPGINGVSYSAALAYLIQTTAAAANPQWTWSGIGGAAHLAVFKAAAGAAFLAPAGMFGRQAVKRGAYY